jgi:DUF2934 family protein
MPGTGKAKAQPDSLEAEKDFREERELREEDRIADEQIVQQDLNQGMDTGTHSSSHSGVNWGSAYRVRPESEQASPTKEQIAARAHELYLQRGGADGHALEDWLMAENELKQR